MGFSRLITLLVLIALMLVSHRLRAETIQVPSDFPTIQQALDAASNGDRVVVGDGTWFENLDMLGKSIIFESANGPELCILNGSLQTAGPEKGNVIRTGAVLAPGCSISGFSIVEGHALFPGSPLLYPSRGGGIFIDSATTGDVEISNCSIQNCSAGSGGGLAYWGGSGGLSLIECEILNCGASQGEAVNAFGTGSLEAISSHFSGSGVDTIDATFATTFANFSQALFISCSFNDSNPELFYGGGLSIGPVIPESVGISSVAEVIDCRFERNSVVLCGGGAVCVDSEVSFQGCVFTGNYGGDGSAICLDGGTYDIANCLIYGDEGHNGIVSSINNTTTTVDHCTIVENDFSTSAVRFSFNNSVNSSISNSILQNNGVENDIDELNGASLGYCNADGNYTGPGVFNQPSTFVDPESGDFHLRSNSPEIDAGDPSFELDPDGSITDMGAFPFDQSLVEFVRADSNLDSIVNIADGIHLIHGVIEGDESFPISCLAAADANSDNLVDLSDAVFIFMYRFLNGPQPATPFPTCGTDESSPLGCEIGVLDCMP